ncbi:cytochrome o ubiquinol oxidase subunit III [Terrihalobacillus insolitus]|uniref:cytochrome o ubiquinol oxidase subunit III n=1 Tax=Terrihalobacillus insolitus TaxID=2950438 RepID=UPI00233F8DBF|nr:cytochrome o ubiquinol oxidase subunit III [Terrihalobacillus insolitus]MDC3415007.1 cytochrome o ubiquinol oxidase subunit III [Terrihalobacillus insolitus]
MEYASKNKIKHIEDEHDHDHEHDESSIKTFGFWVFLITDLILFATLFATYTVLRTRYNGGPTGEELFEIPIFVAETFILLTSSFTSGLATLGLKKKNPKIVIGWLIVTAILGLAFIGLEITEFTTLVEEGAAISTSAFLSAFYVLVGTHGIHVSAGIIWMASTIVQLVRSGITEDTEHKTYIVTLYWHFLDVVWIFIFTVVYLIGVM